MLPRCFFALLAMCSSLPAQSQNAKSPPPGIAVPDKERAELLSGARQLQAEVDALKKSGALPESLQRHSADVEIFPKAVLWALELNEVYNLKQLVDARNLLKAGNERLAQLKSGRTPWTTATGKVVRGYRSKIDGSVQPYGLEIPEDRPAENGRLDVWLHGRSDVLTELAFLTQSSAKPKAPLAPKTVVLNIYGRFCNAYKFAGEVDVLEAMEDAIQQYRFSRDHVALRGFSMGGAGAWHLGAQHISLFAAITPGAGFVETAEYAKVDAPGKTPPTEWERKLFALYDVPGYVLNLSNRPVYLYCGEEDPAKWQGEKMLAAAKANGFEIPQLVGPKTGHKYHPETKKELDALMDAAVARGRPAAPERVRLSTPTLKYNSVDWVTVEALEKHWEISTVDALRVGPGLIEVKTKGVAELKLSPPKSWTTGDAWTVVIDGESVKVPYVDNLHLVKLGKWRAMMSVDAELPALRKRHDLQGPIDDAFMDAFVFVRPTGKSRHPAVDAWVRSEMELAIRRWKVNFRGEIIVLDDVAVTEQVMRSAHLILWGDADSNALIAKLQAGLPAKWNGAKLTVAGQEYDADTHAPVAIYPNPQAPGRYVVLNSGHTFRQGSDVTNALQTPKLPDWAVIDITVPPSAQWPGRVVTAGFFDEAWK